MGKKSKKKDFVDDGRTVYDMDVEGFKWHDRKKQKKDGLDINRREKWAMYRGALAAYLPKFFIILLAFALTMGLIYLWLH